MFQLMSVRVTGIPMVYFLQIERWWSGIKIDYGQRILNYVLGKRKEAPFFTTSFRHGISSKHNAQSKPAYAPMLPQRKPLTASKNRPKATTNHSLHSAAAPLSAAYTSSPAQSPTRHFLARQTFSGTIQSARRAASRRQRDRTVGL